MLPSASVIATPSKDGSKPSDVDSIKMKCEPIVKIQASHVKTINSKTNVQVKCTSQSSVGHIDRTEERHPDKLLRPIAPKPVAIKCVPDMLSVRETDTAITEKQEAVLRNADEINVKTVSAGSTGKCEKDSEEETVMLKKTSTTGRSPPKTVKKKPKQIRDLEKALNCLLSDNEQVKDERAFAFAQSYFLKVTETLHGKDDATYSEFMKTMNDFGVTIFDAVDLYQKVTKIFEKYPTLSEEFLAFLLPEQAMQCGKFMEYIMITKMSTFCRKLELYYSKQPSQLRKIYSSLSTLASNNKATVDDLKNTILPLLRNNSLLVNMFLELMPTEAPRASSLTDYESMDFSSVDIQNPKAEDWFETVDVPPPVEDSVYGGEDCICPCHIPPEGKTRRRSAHCMSCGTKFIQGRVYIHSGSMIRPARVSFKEMKTKAIERLSVKNLKTRRKIDKNQNQPSGSKKNNSSKGDSSTNVSGVSNKLSSPKTSKKTTKAKSLNENQKKSSKTLSPSKASHNKQLSGDKKISKPPRKRLKLLTSNPESPSTSSTVKSHLLSSKKGVSQSEKLTGKSDAKTSKAAAHFSLQPAEPTRRTARSTTRNVALPNDCIQKPNRRYSGNILKGDTVTVLVTDIRSKKSKEELPLKNKSSLTILNVTPEKEGTQSNLSLGSRNVVDVIVVESPMAENLNKVELKIDDDVRNDVDTPLPSDRISEFSESSNVPSNGNTDIPSDETLKEENVGPLELQRREEVHNENMELEHRTEEGSSEDDIKISAKSLKSLHTSSDDSSSDHFADNAIQESTTEDFSHCEENISQSEGDDVQFEMMELENSIENISSEDEKNILDSEDYPFNSSDSEIEDNFQMDVEDSEETKDWSSSSQNEINEDGLNEGNHSSNIINVVASGQPVSTAWTRDEDKIILRTFQSVKNSEHVVQKICQDLPSRSAEEVQCRFQTLMSFLQKMTCDQTSS